MSSTKIASQSNSNSNSANLNPNLITLNISNSGAISTDNKEASKNAPRQSSKLAPHLSFNPKQNLLLNAAPLAAYELLEGSLKLVYVAIGETIYSPGITLNHVFFPLTCVVSLHYVTESGASAETASVGREGMVGVNVVIDRKSVV